MVQVGKLLRGPECNENGDVGALLELTDAILSTTASWRSYADDIKFT